ncbi:MAG: putative toxin-antitoxin system toxin component, PIN family [Armatimonadota bacterium]
MRGFDPPLVLDTNVFVAAGFNPRSDSARVLEEVRAGRRRMVWNEQTRREIEKIVRKIPPLSHAVLEGVFREEDRWAGETDPARFDFVPDPDDRKFAALAEASGAVLVTMDSHLLQARERIATPVVRPGELSAAVDDTGDAA